MKFLNQFIKFDWDSFADGKRFLVTGCSQWKDFDTKEVLGTAVECVIYKDETHYKQSDGEHSTNLFEKLKFKVGKEVSIPAKSFVKPVNVTATVYGEYRNNLSITCDDITVIPTQTKS